jgi:hypothetical protein
VCFCLCMDTRACVCPVGCRIGNVTGVGVGVGLGVGVWVWV